MFGVAEAWYREKSSMLLSSYILNRSKRATVAL